MMTAGPLHYLPIVLLCTALFTGYGAKAQDVFKPEETALPAKTIGNWALPDCGTVDEALMITRHFALKATVEGSRFWPIRVVAQKKDYWILTIEGEKRPVRLEEDGVLKIGILPGKPPKKWPQKWDSLKLDGRNEYMGCAEIPALLPDPLVRVMVRIDGAEAACSASLSESCTRLLFKIADDDKNGKISIQEMKMAGAMLAGIAALIRENKVSRGVMDKTLYESLRESERIAESMLQVKDELEYGDFSGFLSKTDSGLMQKALAEVGTLFPAFREASLAMKAR